MIHAQDAYSVPLVTGTVATDATASASIAVAGYHYATIKAVLPVASATNASAKWTILKVQGGDAATGAWTDIIAGTTNATAGTTQFVLVAHNNTSVKAEAKIHVNLINNPYGYLNVIYQAPASNSTVFIGAELTRADALSTTAAGRNLLGGQGII